MLNENKIAVISTGNGGQSFAAYFASLGFEVTLYAREQERVEMFPSNTFTMSGIFERSADVALISCDMAEVIRDAKLIMVTTPAQYHAIVAQSMCGCLQDGQVIVLNPGRTFGTHEFTSVLDQNGCTAKAIVAETDTFTFTCRCLEPGKPIIYGMKSNVLIAAHRTEHTPEVVSCVRRVFPTIQPASNVLETGFENIGMIFHPVPTLMNLVRMEAKEDFLYYMQAISPLVASMLERLDAERVAVARALGVHTIPVMDWLLARYGSTGENLYDAIQHTDEYAQVVAPKDIYIRYIFEDIPTGCVPMHCIGKAVGVETPLMEQVIGWASAVYQVDFMERGRNESKLDLPLILKQAEHPSLLY